MWDSKSNRIALVLMQLAYFAFVAHSIDLGCLHCPCAHMRSGVTFSTAGLSNSTAGLSNADFVAFSSGVKHSCESNCELCYNSPELVKVALLSFFLFVLWRVRVLIVGRLTIPFYRVCVPLGLTVFLFYSSLLI